MLIVFCLFLGVPSLKAASAAERRAHQTAASLFKDGLWEQAERELGEFARRFPESDKRAEAILWQAQCRFKRRDYAGAVELLSQNLPAAGPWADEYHFWMAEAHFQSAQYTAAAAAYANVLKGFPQSARRLEASYSEAFCRFKLQEWPRVKELLGDPQGDFQRLTKAKPNEEMAVRGYLLLGETLLLLKEFRAGEEALRRLDPKRLAPDSAWKRQYLVCRLRLADGRPNDALEGVGALLDFAEAAKQPALLAEAVVLKAGIHEQLNQLEQAVETYALNLKETASPEQRRQALLKIIQITMARQDWDGAILKLEDFAVRLPQDPAMDLAQFTLGEIKLKRHCEQAEKRGGNPPVLPGEGQTNLLAQALGHFDRLLANFPQSSLTGKAQLNRGWCLWLLGNIPASQTAFQQAAERLPPSLDQAVARFKLGDALLWQKDYTNALAQFRRVTEDYANLREAKESLLDQAFYQIIRCGIAINDLEAATGALDKILAWYPDSYYADRSMLLLGQALNRVDQPAKARQVFQDFLRRFPVSRLAAETRLAMARTYARENLWAQALDEYNHWAAVENARRANPEAEFDRAWVHYKAGQETNALEIFTRFVADFPGHPLAPQAQFWVASYYFRHDDPAQAEANFQRVFQNTNWPPGELTYQARMMAGRAALARQGLKDATDYFLSLINDEKCPTNILLEACFAHGDSLIESPAADKSRPMERFTNAIAMLGKIPQLAPAHPLVPVAQGRIGDCYLQLASTDPRHYDNAAEFYQKTINSQAPVAVRSQAEVGLGLVREKQAATVAPALRQPLLTQALEHYLQVFYGKNLRDDEKADPFWLKKAALSAAALKESQGEIETAEAIYQRLKALVPALTNFCDKKIKNLRERRGATPL